MELVVQDKVSGRRNQVRKLLLEGYKQKEIAQKIGSSLSTVEKDIREIRKEIMSEVQKDKIDTR